MANVKTPREMITPEEMSTRCGLNRENIRMSLRKGTFPVGKALQMESGQWRYLIPRAEFETWMAGRRPSNTDFADSMADLIADRLKPQLI